MASPAERTGRLPEERRDRRASFLRLSVAMIALAAVFLILSASERPSPASLCKGCNLVIIEADVFNGDHLGFEGYFRNTTPNIDALAARSVYFTKAYSASNIPFESDISLFTGKLPSQHGSFTFVADGIGYESLSTARQDYLPAILRDRGYRTAAFLNVGFMNESITDQLGFGEYFGAGFMTGHGPIKDFAWAAGNATEWMGLHGKRPFFVWMQDFDLHGAYRGPGEHFFDADYRGPAENFSMYWKYDFVKRAENGTFVYTTRIPEIEFAIGYHDDGGAYSINRPNGTETWLSERDVEHIIAHYDGRLHETDRKIGDLLGRMESLGLMKNTVIILLGEHGENFGEIGEFGHGLPSNQSHRIPLMFFIPGTDGRVMRGTFSSTEVSATVLHILGYPGKAGLFDGRERTVSLDESMAVAFRVKEPPAAEAEPKEPPAAETKTESGPGFEVFSSGRFYFIGPSAFLRLMSVTGPSAFLRLMSVMEPSAFSRLMSGPPEPVQPDKPELTVVYKVMIRTIWNETFESPYVENPAARLHDKGFFNTPESGRTNVSGLEAALDYADKVYSGDLQG